VEAVHVSFTWLLLSTVAVRLEGATGAVTSCGGV
jgi:hypothetical protein